MNNYWSYFAVYRMMYVLVAW